MKKKAGTCTSGGVGLEGTEPFFQPEQLQISPTAVL